MIKLPGKRLLWLFGVGKARAAAGRRARTVGCSAAIQEALYSVATAPTAVGAAEGLEGSGQV